MSSPRARRRLNVYQDDARRLIASIDTSKLAGLRDRAIIGVMTYSFARVDATTRMRVRDYYSQGRRAWFVLHEKGGRFNRVPVHHKAADVDVYLGWLASPRTRTGRCSGPSRVEVGACQIDLYGQPMSSGW